MVKIVALSDTHTQAHRYTIPECDIFIHAGDATYRGTIAEVGAFGNWLKTVPAKHKIVVPGNHDFLFQKHPYEARALLPTDCHLLIDSDVTIDGIKIYGTPWTPFFYDWAFNGLEARPVVEYQYEGGPGNFVVPDRDHPHLKDIYAKIPNDSNIVICHGPPWGILDTNNGDTRCGSRTLRERVSEIKPKYCIFGHIHQHGGTSKVIDETTYFNVAGLDEDYDTLQPLTVFEY